MKKLLAILFLFPAVPAFSQNTAPYTLDPLSFGVVLDHPDMKKVKVQSGVRYFTDAKSALDMDVYLPPGMKTGEKRPAIVFLNAIGDDPGEKKVKEWGIYTSWPRLMAAYGYVGISMDADADRIQESLQAIFGVIEKNAADWHIDSGRLGVYAASANVRESSRYLMSEKAFPGIKAAALYYGQAPLGPFRKDLPVFFLISEGDVGPGRYEGIWSEILKNNAPWTLRMGTGVPHAFDAYWDKDEARKLILETISFWKNQLDPVPAPSWKPSPEREALGWQRMDESKSLVLFEQLAKEHPDDVATAMFYANGLRRTGRYAEAEPLYKKALVTQPQSLNVLIGAYVTLTVLGKNDEAEGCLKKGFPDGNVPRDLYLYLGYNLLAAEKNGEAARCFESALALEAGSREYYNLACAYAKMNEKEKALNALEKALDTGAQSRAQIENDVDLNSIRRESRYKALLERAQ